MLMLIKANKKEIQGKHGNPGFIHSCAHRHIDTIKNCIREK